MLLWLKRMILRFRLARCEADIRDSVVARVKNAGNVAEAQEYGLKLDRRIMQLRGDAAELHLRLVSISRKRTVSDIGRSILMVDQKRVG